MSQLGRIGGQVLTDNLLRAGVDLAFETDLLYLDVNNQRIGVKTSTPVYDLDVNNNLYTNELTAVTQIAPGNLRINSTNTITTSVGGIDVYIGGSEIFHDRLVTANLVLDGNLISSSSNSDIVFDPNGSGTVDLRTDTDITGDLAVSGNISMSGNLTGLGTLTFGDQTIDTVTINTDFTQSIIPGDDLTYAMGADAGDSSARRWAQLHSPEWRYITTGAWPGSGIVPASVIVSDQMLLDGVNNKISTIQSNEDILLNSHTGIVNIEATRWQNNNITNLLNTPLTLAATNTGYYSINSTNAMIIPSGPDLDRRASPEVGETRWNTDQQYLECYDGTVWAVSIGGGGGTITPADMDNLSNIYTLILG
jgi:hypothetical protein